MNLNQITECGVCGEKCHTIAGPKENPIRIEFDCGSIVEVSSNEYGYQWAKRCGKLSLPKIPFIELGPCRRCGSPAKKMASDEKGNVVSVDYLCGSTIRLASNGMLEFDALCRHTENQPRLEPALASAEEIGMAALEAMQGPTNDSVRAKFAEILFRKLQARDGGAK